MTERNKFEEMLERLVSEDRAGAEELFHEIVVEKSRDIYESLLAEEAEDEIDETTDEEVDESEEDDLEESEEDDLEESEDDDLDESEDDDLEEGFFGEGDPTDDMMGDIEMPGDEMGGDEMDMDMEPEMGDDDMGMGDEDGDVEDRVADLEDELEALKAEFEALMGDEASDDEEGDMDMDMPMDMDSEEGDDEEEAEEESYAFESDDEDEVKETKKSAKTNTEMMREYADKVAPAKMGDNGANAKSTVAKPNNMGGTSANIAKGGEAGAGGTQGGLAAPTAKDMNTKNVNVPGAKGATKLASQPGHGAEKKSKPETADKGAASPLNGAPKRAK